MRLPSFGKSYKRILWICTIDNLDVFHLNLQLTTSSVEWFRASKPPSLMEHQDFEMVDCRRESTLSNLLHQKVPHHSHVLMLQVVAVVHEQSFKILERFDNPYRLARHYQYGIF